MVLHLLMGDKWFRYGEGLRNGGFQLPAVLAIRRNGVNRTHRFHATLNTYKGFRGRLGAGGGPWGWC